MTKRIEKGDIFQILSSEGVCFGQVINTHPKWKHIIAVFRDFSPVETVDFENLVRLEPQFITAFLIQDAVNMGLFTIIANTPVAEHLIDFPIFKGTNNLIGDDTIWWFWDGNKEWKVDRPLTSQEKKIPEGPTLISAPLLVEMVERDYRVERDYI